MGRQFAFGFYSIIRTSSIMGIITLLLFKPRSWCVYCPMGTITQLICAGNIVNKQQLKSSTHFQTCTAFIMPISGQSAHPCNADIFSVNNIILASFFQYNKPHGELNNLFFENQFLSKLQFKYCLTLNISNIFNYIIPLLTNIHL